MTLLLLGLVVAFAAWRLTPHRTTRKGALWVVPLALLVTLQLLSRGDLLTGYQIRVLGQRFALGGEATGRVVSGDREGSDVYVDGAGTTPVARLAVAGDTLRLDAAEGSGSVVLARTGRGPGPDWTVLRSVALREGARIRLSESGASSTWTFHRTPSLLGLRGSVDLLSGEGGGTVAVPYPEGAGFLGLFPGRPSVFQRTYPLADLLASSPASGAAALSSFLYYRDGEPRVAVLDPSVSVEASGEVAAPLASVALGSGAGPKARVMIAGLPHRDFPDPRLSPEERYGVRPLRTFDPRTDDGWMTLSEPRPRVVSLPVAEQDDVSLGLDGHEFFAVWIRPGAGDATLDGVALPEYSQRFGAASQGLLRLPVETEGGVFRLLTPSGLAEWSTGRPFTLGDDDRGILIRVDGLAAALPFHLILLGLFALGALPLLAPLDGRIKALALVAMGLASMRALLSVSALARYPFVDEGHHISLWLIPALPWLVCALGRTARRGGDARGPAEALVPRGFSGGYMGTTGGRVLPRFSWPGRMGARSPFVTVGVPAAALVLLALVLFPTSPARAASLSLLTAAATAWALAGRGWRTRFRPGHLGRRLAGTPFPGALLGAALLLGRGALEVAGFREQVSLGGVRIGLSVLYTPLAALVFAFVLWVHLERVDRGPSGRVPVEVPRAWLDLGLFLATAFVGVSLWISDFGIALTALPGPLLVLLAVGFHWSRRFGPGAALGGLLPLALFLALQVEPRLMQPGLSEGPVSTRLEDWSRNELLLLERGDPDLLRLIGESRSEALAVMRETMRSYTRGSWLGRGFLEGRVSSEIRSTAVREHAVGGLIASQWGVLGTLGLVAMLLAAVLPFVRDLPRGRPGQTAGSPRAWLLGSGLCVAALALLPTPADLSVLVAMVLGTAAIALLPLRGHRTGRIRPWLWWPARDAPGADGAGADLAWLVGAVAVVTFSFAGLYMVLANYGLVLFTGKNVYLLGLDSLGDTLEAMALLGIAAAGLARSGAVGAGERRTDEGVRVEAVEIEERRALAGRRRAG